MKKIVSLLTLALILIFSLNAFAAEKIVIGATPLPHALILEYIKPDFEALGYKLEILEGTDYFIFNPATADGDTNANYFQHLPFLEQSYNKDAQDGKKLVAAFGVHYEPLGLFPGKTQHIEELKDGAEIVMPIDPSNLTRSLILLEKLNLIELPENAFEKGVSIEDIKANPKNLNLIALNADLIPSSIEDYDMAILNGNYAIAAGFESANSALATEDENSDAIVAYTNYLVVNEKDKDAQWVKDLQSVMLTNKVRDFILNEAQFAGAVKPAF